MPYMHEALTIPMEERLRCAAEDFPIITEHPGALLNEAAEHIEALNRRIKLLEDQIQNLRALSYDGDRLFREETAAREQSDRLDQAAEMQE